MYLEGGDDVTASWSHKSLFTVQRMDQRIVSLIRIIVQRPVRSLFPEIRVGVVTLGNVHIVHLV